MSNATELTRDEVNQLREGGTMRIVTPRGVVHQGTIASFDARLTGRISSLWVNGRMFGIPQHEIYRPEESAVVIDPPKESADPAEVRDIIADRCAPGTTEGELVQVKASPRFSKVAGDERYISFPDRHPDEVDHVVAMLQKAGQ